MKTQSDPKIILPENEGIDYIMHYIKKDDNESSNDEEEEE